MTQEDDNKPGKKPARKTNRKAPVKKSSTKKNASKSEKGFDEEYKAKIRAALQTNLDEYLKNRNLSQKQISTINSFVEEHLSCFVLLGYTVNGDPVSLVNAATQKDSDSLGTLLQKFLTKYSDPPSSISMI